MKKRCPECGRLRRLGRFYNNKSQPDGKQIQCKDCQKKRNAAAKKTEHYRVLKRKRDEKWKSKNRDHVQRYNRDYYQKNRERIISRRNTESIIIIENPDKKKINTSRRKTKKFKDDIVINPQRKSDG
jgi:hypothetical protein